MSQSPTPIDRGPRPLLRALACLVAGLSGAVLLGVAGWVTGATIGGNHATDFEFNGVRGYEATGQIGLIAGLVIGGLLGAWFVWRLTKRRG